MDAYPLTYAQTLYLLLGLMSLALLMYVAITTRDMRAKKAAPVEPIDLEARVMPYVRQYQTDREAARERAMRMHPAHGVLSVEDTLRLHNVRRLAVVVDPDEKKS